MTEGAIEVRVLGDPEQPAPTSGPRPMWMLTFIDSTQEFGASAAMSSGFNGEDALTNYLSGSGRDLKRYFDRMIVVAPVEGAPADRAVATRVYTVRQPEPTPDFLIEVVVLDD